jgi:hypothetical protein
MRETLLPHEFEEIRHRPCPFNSAVRLPVPEQDDAVLVHIQQEGEPPGLLCGLEPDACNQFLDVSFMCLDITWQTDGILSIAVTIVHLVSQ